MTGPIPGARPRFPESRKRYRSVGPVLLVDWVTGALEELAVPLLALARAIHANLATAKFGRRPPLPSLHPLSLGVLLA